jgi:hypothetical protein
LNNNRFYKINNPKDRQYLFVLLDLNDISSVQYPNESLNVGIVTTKTGKEYYIQKDELDNIIKFLNIISNPVLANINMVFDIYEPKKGYFPGE